MRLSKDNYFLVLAQAAALRSTCPRRQVGAVLVSEGDVAATGYNGSSPGKEHCQDIGCLMVDNHCVRTTHAEQNALGRGKRGDTLYCTDCPCLMCLKLALTNGVSRIVYIRRYDSDERDLFVAENKLQAVLIKAIRPKTLCLSEVTTQVDVYGGVIREKGDYIV